MKQISALIAAVALVFVTGCGTLGGALEGAGDDLKSLGQMIKN
jgi:predicted small secreted protein